MKAKTKELLIMGAPLAALILVCVGIQQCEFHSSPPQSNYESGGSFVEMPAGMEAEEATEPMVPRQQGEWVHAGRIRYWVVCTKYGNTDDDEESDVLQVNLYIQSQANNLVNLLGDNFYLEDTGGREFRQISSYQGQISYPPLRYEKMNPGTVKEYSLYFDIPEEGEFTFHYEGESGEYVILKPQEKCSLEPYDRSGIDESYTSD